jgi:hypothetical protein
MTILLVIAVIAAAIYLYAAVAYYQAFKNWSPLCGCKGGVCGTKGPARDEGAEKEAASA